MKKFLLSLFVWFVWIISFCSAWVYTVEWEGCFWRIPIPVSSYWDCNFTVNCTFTTTDWYAFLNFRVSNFNWNWYNLRNSSNLLGSSITPEVWSPAEFNYDFSTYVPSNWNSCLWIPFLRSYTCNDYSNWTLHYSCVFSWDKILSVWWTCPECPICPEINTWEILSWYILASEIDTNYCVWNWLCPNECGSWTDFSWDLQYSNIYINSILHPWEENIFIDIPDYIQWDYSITTWDFNIYVWSWYDMDYMNSIIKINSYRPDSTDFTDVFVSGLTLIFPYIFVVLLLMFIWKLLKRIFK